MTVCAFLPSPSSYLREPVGDKSTLERFEQYVTGLPDSPVVVAMSTRKIPDTPADWRWVIRESWNVASLIESIAEVVSGPDDTILFTFLDQPFLNAQLTGALLDRHETYRADYTFADGYPVGLAPELLRGRALSYIRELASSMNGPVARSSLFEVIQKDMNRFDIETELSRTDQRLLRLLLAVDTRANLEVCRSLASDAPQSSSEWSAHVESRRLAHRSLPRYVSVQVVEQEVQRVAYSPYPSVRDDVLQPGAIMSAEQFAGVVSQIAELSPEAVISFSHWGEVGLHPEVMKLVDAVLEHPGLGLVVETSGVGWSRDARADLLSRDRVVVIVGLDTDDASLYHDIRGEGFNEAVEFAQAALAANPERAYVQAVRCDLTEPVLDSFFKRWTAVTDNVIIQKYDWFSGRLAQLRVGDIAPLKRFPCWHLQRDLTILVDGRVPLCREDLTVERPLGNVFQDGVRSVWEHGEQEFGLHVAGEYRGVCEQCDEYYTFNF